MSTGYLTAKQASKRLGVSLSTLYAYVSRGLIQSEPDVIKSRRRYRAEDVENLLARKSGRAAQEKDLAEALHWGEPLCESRLTLIQDGQLFYRGVNTNELLGGSFESTVELLWEGYEPRGSRPLPEELASLLREKEPLERFSLALTWLAQQDERAFDLRGGAVRETGARILHALFSTLCEVTEGENLAAALARGWCPGHRSELEAALILCADHELNVSAFTARCVASAGATPYQVVIAGLAALGGFRHGGHAYGVEALFREAEALGAERAICSLLRRGAPLPGFGHKLYPQGDPRARQLLRCLDPVPEPAAGLVDAADRLLGRLPNIDFALVTLAQALHLPPGAHIGLFALGRCTGWIAHALEQYATERLIRPRARYVGQLPVEA